jgi:hypothetical protein
MIAKKINRRAEFDQLLRYEIVTVPFASFFKLNRYFTTGRPRIWTGTKGEKLNFYSSNILNLPLVPVLNPKSATFGTGTKIQRNRRKKFKKSFFPRLVPVQIPYFWT